MKRVKLFSSYGVDDKINTWCEEMANRKDIIWEGIEEVVAIPAYTGSEVLVIYNFEKVRQNETSNL